MYFYTDKALYQSLFDLEIIEPAELEELYKFSQTIDQKFAQVLVDKNAIEKEHLAQVVADLLKLPYIKLANVVVEEKVLQLIPEEFAIKQKIIVFKEDEKVFSVVTPQPSNYRALEFVRKKLAKPIKVHLDTINDFEAGLLLYKKQASAIFKEIIDKSVKEAEAQDDIEPPIIQIVDTIIHYSAQRKASDIHIEPYDNFTLVRLRIDGILHDIVKLPLVLHERIVTRIKVMSNLRTDEHLQAQDGKIQWQPSNPDEIDWEHKLDLRVSVVPSTDGEKIVMRLLSEQAKELSLESLGYADDDLEKIRKAYSRPQGMILATGPTGSGKTTTMYSILKLLNKRSVNISTIEDPVEYDIDGITQIQVNSRTNLTFAKGLRSIVRQDPDIILVGEIRDEETSGIAINAAMTGHLVLSTLHTNDAATAIPRLMDMGIEPYLLSSTLNLVVAQRLVRKIHMPDKVSYTMTTQELEEYFSRETIRAVFGEGDKHRVYKGKGCEICHGTGYQGRLAICEVMLIDDEIRQAITAKKDASEIRQIAIKNGMRTMVMDGLEKVKAGLTTIDEILRVTKD